MFSDKSKQRRRRSSSNDPTRKRTEKLMRKKRHEETQNSLLNYYQVRRSVRLTENEEKIKTQNGILEQIKNGVEKGLEIKTSTDKGRGVYTVQEFKKGDYIVEYAGDLIDYKTALKRESVYEKNNCGSYMFFFNHKNKRLCVDATAETGRYGRLLNHSRLKFNLISKITEIDGKPIIIFFASKDIPVGVELLYDYGDRSKKSLTNNPWLRY